MKLPRYEEYEGEFLEAMATRYGFTGKNSLIFEKRFLEANAGLTGEQLAKQLEKKLLEGIWEKSDAKRFIEANAGLTGTELAKQLEKKLLEGIWEKSDAKRFIEANAGLTGTEFAKQLEKKLLEVTLEKSDAKRIFRQQLSAICKKLEEAGCPSAINGKDRWKNCKRWLREEVFPEWAKEQGLVADTPQTIAQLWDRLKEKATIATTQIEVMVSDRQLATLGARRKNTGKTVPLNSDIEYHLHLDGSGYLILLEREPSGVVCCLCPSEYAPNFRRTKGVTILPQNPPSPFPFFGADERGREQLLALITSELPPLDWLQQSQQEALELDNNHLNELLAHIERSPDAQVLYTEYTVV